MKIKWPVLFCGHQVKYYLYLDIKKTARYHMGFLTGIVFFFLQETILVIHFVKLKMESRRSTRKYTEGALLDHTHPEGTLD